MGQTGYDVECIADVVSRGFPTSLFGCPSFQLDAHFVFTASIAWVNMLQFGPRHYMTSTAGSHRALPGLSSTRRTKGQSAQDQMGPVFQALS